ncbi:hypothetical protein F5146DRAFT_1227865 [Armillaria mellea]|nr:hypothetical protein F5146DRAFT_1227865 [Armillaria mellea]
MGSRQSIQPFSTLPTSLSRSLLYSTVVKDSASPVESTDSGGAVVTVTRLSISSFLTGLSSTRTLTIDEPSPSLQTSSSPATNQSSRKKTSPATIAGIIIGSLAAVIVLALLFILWWRWKRKRRSMAGNNADEEIDVPEPVLRPSSASVRTVSISTTNSLTSDLPGRLSQPSRNVYEEEIERLRQEALSCENQIRYMHEQMELKHGSTPPPSYRSSRRSDASDTFVSSSTLPPSLPTRAIPHAVIH